MTEKPYYAGRLMEVPLGCPLTARGLQVVAGIGNGLTYKQIGILLGISPSTVRTHAHHAFGRLGVVSGVHAAIICWQNGWLALDVDRG